MKPLNNYLYVRPIEDKQGTFSTPDKLKGSVQKGEVLSVSESWKESDKFTPIKVSKGDMVILRRHSGVVYEGNLLVKVEDLIAVI